MTSLVWKLHRLRAMGAPEVMYRLRHAAQVQWEKRGLGLARASDAAAHCGRAWVTVLPHDLSAEPYRVAADQVLAGRFDVFALRGVQLGFPPCWNRDPKTATIAPLVFGKTLNYRDERIVGDIKYLWEPNRHAELVTLAQAWWLTGDTRYADGCRVLLDSWFEQCPYPLGVNWTSSLEHGVRLLNWAVAWHMLGSTAPEAGGNAAGPDAGCAGPLLSPAWEGLRRRWLDSIHRHCHFIAGHLSRHSSANNHLLGELMGLLVASLTWPCWPQSSRWRAKAAAEFEREALTQTAPDGVNREQAIWYHHEVADMMLHAGLFARANGLEFSAAYWQRLEAMLDFIAAVMDVSGRLPMTGDADDARMVRWVPAGQDSVFHSLLATGAVLFERPDLAAKAGRFDAKSRWLLGAGAPERFDALAARAAPGRWPRAFPQGGYYVLGADLDTADEVRLVADAGPLGYLSIAAHGHADALAFTLSARGRELLIDPGTYAYHTQRRWRDYFKGTSAHNTVRVDGLDQSVSGGNFLWRRHARAWCEHWETGPHCDVLTAAHDGYLRLADPVRHRRTIALDKPARRVAVTDVLGCRARHRVELHWHFAEGCEVQVDADAVRVRHRDVELSMTMPGSRWVPQLVTGREEPPLGWISRRFDEKAPITTVVWGGHIDTTTSLLTELQLAPAASMTN